MPYVSPHFFQSSLRPLLDLGALCFFPLTFCIVLIRDFLFSQVERIPSFTGLPSFLASLYNGVISRVGESHVRLGAIS